MKMYKRMAKSISFGAKRKKKNIKYIVIHFTNNIGDTARNNVDFFATGNTREAGAHFFVDSKGNIARSIPMNIIAYAVGGFYNKRNGAGTYYKKCTNENSVSIELCNCVKNFTEAQAKATKKLVKYIQRYCPNAQVIIRHWDVNGKACPGPMTGKSNKMWKSFLNKIS